MRMEWWGLGLREMRMVGSWMLCCRMDKSWWLRSPYNRAIMMLSWYAYCVDSGWWCSIVDEGAWGWNLFYRGYDATCFFITLSPTSRWRLLFVYFTIINHPNFFFFSNTSIQGTIYMIQPKVKRHHWQHWRIVIRHVWNTNYKMVMRSSIFYYFMVSLNYKQLNPLLIIAKEDLDR